MPVLVLVLGLAVFLGMHSIRIVADDWRSARIASVGERSWKRLYAVGSLVGFALIVWGYSIARQQPVSLWVPPLWTRHAAALLVLVAFILFGASNGPPNHFKAAIGHPMYAGTIVWAGGHLLANGTLADLLLFGSFLVWAVAGFGSARARDRRNATTYPPGKPRATLIAVVAGTVAWAVFAFLLHGPLIGVRPLG